MKKTYQETAFYIFATAPIVIGLIVMFGWTIESTTVVQLLPDFVPMQFNTAFCFFLAGSGLISAQSFKFIITLLCGIIVALISSLTLLQYAFGIDLGIDQFFITHKITTLTSHPGRMSPNSAVAFLIVGISLVMESAFWEELYFKVRYWILGGASIALGLNSLTGYIFHVKIAIGWAYSGMAVHTSLCFISLGIAVVILGFFRVNNFQIGQRILGKSIIVFMLGAGLALFMAQFIKYQQIKEYFLTNNVHAENTTYILNRSLSILRSELSQNIQAWEKNSDKNVLSKDIENYMLDRPAIGDIFLYTIDNQNTTQLINHYSPSNPKLSFDKSMELFETILAIGPSNSHDDAYFYKEYIVLSNVIWPTTGENKGYGLFTVVSTGNVVKFIVPEYIAKNFSVSISHSDNRSDQGESWLNLVISKPIKIGSETAYLNLSEPSKNIVSKQYLWWLIFLQGVLYSGLLSLFTYLVLYRQLETKNMSLIQEKTSSGLIEVDLGGTIRAANPSACRMFEYEKSALIGRPIEELIPIDAIQHEELRQKFLRGNINRRIGKGILYGLNASGTKFPVTVDLSIFQSIKNRMILATVTDLTDRQEIFLRLERQKVLFTEFMYKTNTWIVEIDKNSLIASANSSLLLALGYEVSDLIGKPVQSIVFSGEKKILSEVLELGTEQDCKGEKIHLVTKQNESIGVDFLFLPEQAEDGTFNGGVLAFTAKSYNYNAASFRAQTEKTQSNIDNTH